MRILAIRGRNLASLAREFALELDRPPLRDVGLFAITGPVGAGKSTLLDAVCLALFDRTPRLHGRGGSELADPGQDPLRSNDVRSVLRHDAPEGFAEVEFLGVSGKRMRARWTVRRARQRVDGRLQAQEMSLVDVASGAQLGGGRKTDVLAAIERELGLEFAQFRRSVLLAQGDFAAFLQASASERAALLERLTDAEVYRKLSKAAFERARHERQQLDTLQAQFDEHRPLADEARRQLEHELQVARRDHAVASVGVQVAMRHVNWHRQAERWREAEAQAGAELNAARERERQAAPRVRRLERMRAAMPFAAAAGALAEQRRQGASLQRKADAAAAAVAAARSELGRSEQTCREALVAIGAGPTAVPPLVAEFARWEADLLERRRLAQAIETGQRALSALQHDVAAAAAAVRSAGERIAQAQSVRDEAVAARDGAEARLGEPRFVGLPARRVRRDEARDRLALLVQRQEAWARADAEVTRRERELAASDTGIAADAARIPALARERTASQAALVQARRAAEHERRQQSVAAHRVDLHAGEPCPLCGATEHPWAGEPPPSAGAATAEQAAEEAFAAARDAEVAAEAALRQRQRQREITAQQLADARVAVQAAQQAWRAVATPEPGLLDAGDPAAAGAVLAAHRERDGHEDAALRQVEAELAVAERQVRQVRERLVAAERELARVAALAQGAQTQHGNVQARQQQQQERLAALDDDLARLRERLQPAWCGIADAERTLVVRGDVWVAAVRAAADAVAEVARVRGRVDGLVARADEGRAAAVLASEELAVAEQVFAQQLERHGVTVAEVEDARSSDAAAFAAEEAALRELHVASERARSVLIERTKNLQEHDQRDRPEMDLAQSELALKEARAAEERDERLAADREVARRLDDAARQHRAEIAPRLQQQQQVVQTWAALDDLIGSSGGDKFGVFAQGLTMDLLLAEANRRLAELARRYQLRRLPQADLDFAIVDRDLGGALRSVRSLSGGETFLVSLALALALASLAAERTRIETLFLDEGFGTLDAQSLETALSALDALQANGCQVGVISHVEGFAERVGTVVQVVPDGAGQSRLCLRS